MSHEQSSKKRSREESGQSVAAFINNLHLDFDIISRQIQIFKTTYLPLASQIHESAVPSMAQPRGLNIRLFTPVDPLAEKYIETIRILFEQHLKLNEITSLIDEINVVQKMLDEEVDAEERAQQSQDLIQWKEVLREHVTFIRGEINSLVNVERHSGNHPLKKGISDGMQAFPDVLNWFNTHKHRLITLDALHAAFDTRVGGQLVELQAQLNVHLEEMEAGMQALKEATSRTYPEIVECCANYCTTVLKQVQETITVLSRAIEFTDKNINEMRQVDSDADVGALVQTIIMFEGWKATLGNNVNKIYRPMREFAEQYNDNANNLTHQQKVFMRPWLNSKHPCPLEAAIHAYTNPNALPLVVQQTREPAPVISEADRAKREVFERQRNRRL